MIISNYSDWIKFVEFKLDFQLLCRPEMVGRINRLWKKHLYIISSTHPSFHLCIYPFISESSAYNVPLLYKVLKLFSGVTDSGPNIIAELGVHISRPILPTQCQL